LSNTIKQYLSLVKFSHTIFAMPFAMIGYFLAVHDGYAFTWKIFLLVIACMITARSAAMAFNRWLDKHFDALNPRTAIREIPAGIISTQHALLFVIVCCVLFIITCAFINITCFILSPVALFVVLGYSYTKRFTVLCHAILGVGLALAPIGAYVAMAGSFALLPILFSFIVIFWVSGFDIIYALQDEAFDRAHHLQSIPALLGKSTALIVSRVLHSITALFVLFIGGIENFRWMYWAGAIIFIGMLIYQHILVKPNNLSKVNIAFMITNGIASITFAIFTIIEISVR